MEKFKITINGASISASDDQMIHIECDDYATNYPVKEFKQDMIKQISSSLQKCIPSKEMIELLDAENRFHQKKMPEEFIDHWKMFQKSGLDQLNFKIFEEKFITKN